MRFRERPGRRSRSSTAPLAPHLRQDLSSVVDIADGLSQRVPTANRDGRGRGNRGWREHDGRVESQERNAEKPCADRSLNDRSLGETSPAIDRGSHGDGT